MTATDPSIRPDAAAPVVRPGDVLGGKFRVERIVGEGGMGVVVEATHLQLDERVAIKFLRRDAMALPDVVARFDREGRAAVKLKSEHVCRMIDVGTTADGIPFLVMEYLEGKDLAQLLSERGPLEIMDAVEYLIQSCEGVGEAHAKGIVHRDLKPENLFVVDRQGWKSIKVLDFGISKAALTGRTSAVDMSQNQTSVIMGSPYYMSPEQLRSTKSVDHRADVWSLGVVLFELLTGTTPFDETLEFTELVAEILESPHRRLRQFRADAPAELEAVIDKALAKDRAQRFQNTAELAIALLPFAPSRARVTAERTTSISRAAGLLVDPNVRLPPSIPPPGDPGHASAPSQPSAPRALTPSDVRAMQPAPAIPSAAPSGPSLAPASGAEGRRKKPSLAVLVLGAVVLLGLGGGLAALVIRSLTQGSTTAPTASNPATATADPTIAATTVATATAPTATATATDPVAPTATVTAPASTAPTATARPTVTARATNPIPTKPPPAPSATAAPKPSSTSSEISHER
jgi:serine/threonine-protein kinase